MQSTSYPKLDRSEPFDFARFSPWRDAMYAARAELRRQAAQARNARDAAAEARATAALDEFGDRLKADQAFMHGFFEGWQIGVRAVKNRDILARLAGSDDENVDAGVRAGLREAATRAHGFNVELAVDLRRAAERLVRSGDAS
jgi:hypothetical protein